jgi:membrane protease YdiL (CAAX protease family)
MKTRLIAWTSFVLVFAALSYSARATEGQPDSEILYRWSTAGAYVFQYAVIAGIVFAIATVGGRHTELFALRRPRSWRRSAAIGVGVILGMIVLSALLGPVLHPGREQGLTPSHWEPEHAAAYVTNALAVAVVTPIVEELTFRGLGFSLWRRYGEWTAILVTGLLFGVAHGLVEALPFLVAFGIGLAYLRSRADSVYPGMIVHGLFNASALIFAVVH